MQRNEGPLLNATLNKGLFLNNAAHQPINLSPPEGGRPQIFGQAAGTFAQNNLPNPRTNFLDKKSAFPEFINSNKAAMSLEEQQFKASLQQHQAANEYNNPDINNYSYNPNNSKAIKPEIQYNNPDNYNYNNKAVINNKPNENYNYAYNPKAVPIKRNETYNIVEKQLLMNQLAASKINSLGKGNFQSSDWQNNTGQNNNHVINLAHNNLQKLLAEGSSSGAHLVGTSHSGAPHLVGGSSGASHVVGVSNPHLVGGSHVGGSHVGGGSSSHQLVGGGSSSHQLVGGSSSHPLVGGSSSHQLVGGSSSHLGSAHHLNQQPHLNPQQKAAHENYQNLMSQTLRHQETLRHGNTFGYGNFAPPVGGGNPFLSPGLPPFHYLN